MENITSEELEKFGIITLVITKEWIENKYFVDIDGAFKRFLENPTKYENKIIILVNGYDEDPRPIWEITEIRDYFQTLDMLFPYWFYFLKKEKDAIEFGIKMIMILLIPVKTIKNDGKIATTEYDIPASIKFIENHFISLNELTDKIGLTLEDNKRISKEVMECFENI